MLCNKLNCSSVFKYVVFAIALTLGVLVSFWPQERLTEILMVTRFFEVMLPVLAVGALTKYLIYPVGKCGFCKKGCQNNSCNFQEKSDN